MRELIAWISAEDLTENPWFNETFYLRFCRARKFDLPKIKEMFLKYMEYRRENQLDDIIYVSLFCNFTDIKAYLTFNFRVTLFRKGKKFIRIGQEDTAE